MLSVSKRFGKNKVNGFTIPIPLTLNGRKGQIKILEAVIAVLIILGFMIYITNKTSPAKPDLSDQIYKIQRQVLTEVANNVSLRDAVLKNDEDEVKLYLKDRLSPYIFEFNISICAINAPCPCGAIKCPQQVEIFADEVIINSNLSDLAPFGPQKLAMYMWIKPKEKPIEKVEEPACRNYDQDIDGSYTNSLCPGQPDCDDRNANIKPGATEACNGIDDNCNNNVDDALTSIFCSEQRGVCAGSTQKCGGTAGWLACTDADYISWGNRNGKCVFGGIEYDCYGAEISGAAHSQQYCSDGKDNNCDGQVDEC